MTLLCAINLVEAYGPPLKHMLSGKEYEKERAFWFGVIIALVDLREAINESTLVCFMIRVRNDDK